MSGIRLGTLTVFLSWRCSFSCEHCGFSCGPGRKEKMPLDRILRAIDTVAAANRDLRMVAYSGGEPFLAYREMKEAMGLAHWLGLAGGVVTNCYWALRRDIARERLRELAALGLEEVIVSLDDFHLQYVPLENIRCVVAEALEAGVRVGVNMLVTKTSHVRAANAPDLLGIAPEMRRGAPPEIRSRDERIWFRESSPLPVGRARRSVSRRELVTYGEEDLLDKPCCFVGSNIVLTPGGSLYACCGFGDADRHGPAAVTYVGPYGEEPFQRVFRRVTHNAFFNLLARCGPYRLVKWALAADPSLRVRQRYVSSCEVCHEISRNHRLREVVTRLIRRAAASGHAGPPA